MVKGQERHLGSPPRMRGKVRDVSAPAHGTGITPAYAGKSTGKATTADIKQGSPPHMRGKESFLVHWMCRYGITPACAGKRAFGEIVNGLAGDHPRMCGEKRYLHYTTDGGFGSPPHVRGKDLQRPRQHRRAGITPACAGKSEKTALTTMCRRDHPRMCGEKDIAPVSPIGVSGSPPRMRGKAQFVNLFRGDVRITPAHAGKRPRTTRCTKSQRDHPRVCGEKRFPRHSSVVVKGSPPRMRGKVAGLDERQEYDWDHPRVCGEKSCATNSGGRVGGSPPRMRGKAAALQMAPLVTRITPAYAGKSRINGL